MKLDLDDAYEAFLSDTLTPNEKREALMEALEKFTKKHGKEYAGLVNIYYRVDNMDHDLQAAYHEIKEYCAANDIRCDALDEDAPVGWGDEEDDEDCEVYKKQH